MDIRGYSIEKEDLDGLLDEARGGKTQLPDFQRGWVWDDDHIKSLLASISLGYPIGAVMMLPTGGKAIRFKQRPLEGARVPVHSGGVEWQMTICRGNVEAHGGEDRTQ